MGGSLLRRVGGETGLGRLGGGAAARVAPSIFPWRLARVTFRHGYRHIPEVRSFGMNPALFPRRLVENAIRTDALSRLSANPGILLKELHKYEVNIKGVLFEYHLYRLRPEWINIGTYWPVRAASALGPLTPLP
jgi:hypothetical protein